MELGSAGRVFLLECETLVVQGGVRGEKGRGGQGLALPAGHSSAGL